MKKRIITLVLMAAVFVTQLIVPMQISASGTIPDPVFTMDLSDSTEDTIAIKNSVTSSNSGVGTVNTPNARIYYTIDGDKIVALQTASETDGTVLGAVTIDNTEMANLVGNGDEMTITFWVKPYGFTGNKSMFHYGSTTNTGDAESTMGNFTYKDTNSSELKPLGATATHSGANLGSGSWKFVAVSRKITYDETTKKYSGTYATIQDSTVVTGTKELKSYKDTTNYYFTIGARYKSNSSTAPVQQGFKGEIAGFSIYNTALSADQLQAIKDNALDYNSLIAAEDMPDSFAELKGDKLDVLTENDDKISVKFTKEMNPETINESTFTLTDITDADNKMVVNTDFAGYNSEDNTAAIALKEYLVDGHTYEVTHQGTLCCDGFPAVKTSVIFTTDFDGTKANAEFAADNMSATVTVSDIKNGATVRAFLMLYDDKGRAVELSAESLAEDGSVTCTLKTTPGKDYKLKCFVWETMGDKGNRVILNSEAVVSE